MVWGDSFKNNSTITILQFPNTFFFFFLPWKLTDSYAKTYICMVKYFLEMLHKQKKNSIVKPLET